MPSLAPRLPYMRAKRIAIGLSQTVLSQATGIPQYDISSIETGRMIPTAEQLAALARVLQIPTDLLLRPVPLGEPEPAGAAR